MKAPLLFTIIILIIAIFCAVLTKEIVFSSFVDFEKTPLEATALLRKSVSIFPKSIQSFVVKANVDLEKKAIADSLLPQFLFPSIIKFDPKNTANVLAYYKKSIEIPRENAFFPYIASQFQTDNIVIDNNTQSIFSKKEKGIAPFIYPEEENLVLIKSNRTKPVFLMDGEVKLILINPEKERTQVQLLGEFSNNSEDFAALYFFLNDGPIRRMNVTKIPLYQIITLDLLPGKNIVTFKNLQKINFSDFHLLAQDNTFTKLDEKTDYEKKSIYYPVIVETPVKDGCRALLMEKDTKMTQNYDLLSAFVNDDESIHDIFTLSFFYKNILLNFTKDDIFCIGFYKPLFGKAPHMEKLKKLLSDTISINENDSFLTVNIEGKTLENTIPMSINTKTFSSINDRGKPSQFRNIESVGEFTVDNIYEENIDGTFQFRTLTFSEKNIEVYLDDRLVFQGTVKENGNELHKVTVDNIPSGEHLLRIANIPKLLPEQDIHPVIRINDVSLTRNGP